MAANEPESKETASRTTRLAEGRDGDVAVGLGGGGLFGRLARGATHLADGELVGVARVAGRAVPGLVWRGNVRGGSAKRGLLGHVRTSFIVS